MLEGSEPLVVGKAEVRWIQRELVAGTGKGDLSEPQDLAELFRTTLCGREAPVGLPGKERVRSTCQRDGASP